MFNRYDGPSRQSRIDYYGGMVKTYQLGTSGKFGSNIKVAPVTTETELNINTCLQVNGTYDNKVMPQSILPSLLDFECVGEEIINGQHTEKWQLTQIVQDKRNKYTLWMKYMDDPRQPEIKAAVPLRYEMKGFNSLLGSHYDHYYLEYDGFSVEDINADVFKIDTS